MRTAEALWTRAARPGLAGGLCCSHATSEPGCPSLSSESPTVEVSPWVSPEILSLSHFFFSPADLQGFSGEKKEIYVYIYKHTLRYQEIVYYG